MYFLNVVNVCNMEYLVMHDWPSPIFRPAARGDMYTQKTTSPFIVYLRPII